MAREVGLEPPKCLSSPPATELALVRPPRPRRQLCSQLGSTLLETDSSTGDTRQGGSERVKVWEGNGMLPKEAVAIIQQGRNLETDKTTLPQRHPCRIHMERVERGAQSTGVGLAHPGDWLGCQ